MSITRGSVPIKTVYANGKKIKRIYKGNVLVFKPVRNTVVYLLWRDIDSNGVLSTATGSVTGLYDFVVELEDSAMESAFVDSTELTGEVSFANLTTIGEDSLYKSFYGCTGLTGTVNFPKLTDASYMAQTFSGCTGITAINFPELVTSTGTTTYGSEDDHDGLTLTFSGCTGLTSVAFPKMTTIGKMYCTFKDCTSLQSADFSSATEISGPMVQVFYGCTSLQSADFSNVETISGQVSSLFAGCTSLQSADFSKLRTIAKGGVFYINTFSDLPTASTFHSVVGNIETLAGTLYFSNLSGCLSDITSISFDNLQRMEVHNSNSYYGSLERFAYYMEKLETVSFPKLTEIHFCADFNSSTTPAFGYFSFMSCPLLRTLEFPELTSITRDIAESTSYVYSVCVFDSYMLNDCPSITRLDFPKLVTIDDKVELFQYGGRFWENITEVHFNKKLAETHSTGSSLGLTDNTNKYTVYFDLGDDEDA